MHGRVDREHRRERRQPRYQNERGGDIVVRHRVGEVRPSAFGPRRRTNSIRGEKMKSIRGKTNGQK